MIRGVVDTWLRRRAAEEILAAYFAWWQACGAVREAYRNWTTAPRATSHSAFRDYSAALERERQAAEIYAVRARRLDHVAWAAPA